MGKSLIESVLGARFGELHPKSRERHSFDSDDKLYSIGIGTANRVWNGSRLFWPFLKIGSARNIMFTEVGQNIPLEILCYAYKDSFGRETLSLNRTFAFTPPREFNEYVVRVPESRSLIIYVGSHQHLAVELTFDVSTKRGLLINTGKQRILSRGLAFRFPLIISAAAEIHEWYDDSNQCFRIEGRVKNRILGDVFGFEGSFQSTVKAIGDVGIPKRIMPLEEDCRW